MARDFDGADDYLTRADDAALGLTTITLACWVYPDTLNTGDVRILVSKGNRTGASINYDLHLRDAASNGASGLWLVWNNGGFRWIETTAQDAVVTGSWQHVAAAYDGGTTKKLWVGGSSEAVTDNSGDTALVTNNETLDLGRRQAGTPANEWYDGRMAEVGLWSAVLTDAEVASLAKGVSPLQVRPGSLVAYWPLYGRGSTEPEYVNGLGLTVDGPVAAEHPRAYRPWAPPAVAVPAAAPAFDAATFPHPAPGPPLRPDPVPVSY